jgi:hypothetical protein
LIPVFEQKFIEEQKRIQNTGEDKGGIVRTQSGSDRGLLAGANGIEKDEIRLTDVMYDYDLSIKGKYFVRIEKAVPNLKGNEQIIFVLDNIEIQVQ